MKYYYKIIMLLLIENYITFSYILNLIFLGPWLFSYGEAQVFSAIFIILSPISMPFVLYGYYKYYKNNK